MRLDVLQTLCRGGFQPPATPDFRWCPNAHAARFRHLRVDTIRPYRAYAKYKQGTLFIFSVPCLHYSVGLLS